MRLRGLFLFAAAASVGALLTFAGPAAATINSPLCYGGSGDAIASSLTLTSTMYCISTGFDAAIVAGQSGVTINLNGHSLVIGGSGQRLGTYVGVQTAGYNSVTINGPGAIVCDYTTNGSMGVDTGDRNSFLGLLGAPGGSGVTVNGVTFAGCTTGVNLDYTMSAQITGNEFVQGDNGEWHQYGGYGVRDHHGTADTISGNDFVYGGSLYTCGNSGSYTLIGGALQTRDSAGTTFSGNTVNCLKYGVHDERDSAGLMITNNIFGKAAVGYQNTYGVYLEDHGSGDMITNNYFEQSTSDGVYDRNSFNQTYVGNIAQGGGDGFDINANGRGFVTMTNNYAQGNFLDGFRIDRAYNGGNVPGPPYSMFSGNSAESNAMNGFYDNYSVGATWSKNTSWNNGNGGTTVGTTYNGGNASQGTHLSTNTSDRWVSAVNNALPDATSFSGVPPYAIADDFTPPYAVTLNGFTVSVTNFPGYNGPSGAISSWTFTLYVSASGVSTPQATGISCTISGFARQCTSAGSVTSYAGNGDTFAILVHPNNTPYIGSPYEWVATTLNASQVVPYFNSGFYFDSPWRETITQNTSTLSGWDGFTFDHYGSYSQPLEVSNNSSTNNFDFGFASNGDPVAGSGNTASGNGAGMSYLVSGVASG